LHHIVILPLVKKWLHMYIKLWLSRMMHAFQVSPVQKTYSTSLEYAVCSHTSWYIGLLSLYINRGCVLNCYCYNLQQQPVTIVVI